MSLHKLCILFFFLHSNFLFAVLDRVIIVSFNHHFRPNNFPSISFRFSRVLMFIYSMYFRRRRLSYFIMSILSVSQNVDTSVIVFGILRYYGFVLTLISRYYTRWYYFTYACVYASKSQKRTIGSAASRRSGNRITMNIARYARKSHSILLAIKNWKWFKTDKYHFFFFFKKNV